MLRLLCLSTVVLNVCESDERNEKVEKPKVVVRIVSLNDDYLQGSEPVPQVSLFPDGTISLGRGMNIADGELKRLFSGKDKTQTLLVDLVHEKKMTFGVLLESIDKLRGSVPSGISVTIIIRSQTLKTSAISR